LERRAHDIPARQECQQFLASFLSRVHWRTFHLDSAQVRKPAFAVAADFHAA
jgi:hypothetical protein